MKKNQLITIALIGMAVACNAMSLTEKIILSKSTEMIPVSAVGETTDAVTLTIIGIAHVTNNRQAKGVERLAIKAMKNISRFLVKELCRVSNPESSSRQNISYTRGHCYDARIMAGPNLTVAVQ